MALILYIARHGEAQAPVGVSDDKRTLTLPGRAEAQRMARYLISQGDVPGIILSSPLLRTRQTAEIYAKIFKLKTAFESDGLAPGQNSKNLMKVIRPFLRQCPLVVAHAPDVGALVNFLTDGRESVVFEPGAVARLELPEFSPGKAPCGRLAWITAPRLIPEESAR